METYHADMEEPIGNQRNQSRSTEDGNDDNNDGEHRSFLLLKMVPAKSRNFAISIAIRASNSAYKED